MLRLLVINKERRDWSKRDHEVSFDRRTSQEVTRRYLLMVDQAEIREAIQKEFEVYPHESGKEFIFYCMARSHCRRAKEFVKVIMYKLKKRVMDMSLLDELEIYTA